MAAGSTRLFHYGWLTDLQAARLLIIHALVVIACMFLIACAGSSEWRGTPKADAAARIAEKQVDKPREEGGTGPNSFDCSGLVFYSYKEAGMSVPRTTKEQYQSRQFRTVSKSSPRRGDLLFFYPSASHVGIYIGNDKFVHVSSKKKRVLIAFLSDPHWQENFAGIRRVEATVVALKY